MKYSICILSKMRGWLLSSQNSLTFDHLLFSVVVPWLSSWLRTKIGVQNVLECHLFATCYYIRHSNFVFTKTPKLSTDGTSTERSVSMRIPSWSCKVFHIPPQRHWEVNTWLTLLWMCSKLFCTYRGVNRIWKPFRMTSGVHIREVVYLLWAYTKCSVMWVDNSRLSQKCYIITW